MARKSAKVKLRPEKALSALRGGSVGIMAGMLVAATIARTTLAEDCKGTWDIDIGTPGMDATGVSSVRTFELFNNMTLLGGQNELYAGGHFKTAGGRDDIWCIAKWEGGAVWGRIDGLPPNSPIIAPSAGVNALQAWGTGNDYGLYLGGDFPLILDGRQGNDDLTVNYIAQWDGTDYKAITSQSNVGVNGIVRALTVFDHDNNPQTPIRLVAGGDFTTAGGVMVNHVAMWDGTSWTALGTGTSGTVWTLKVFDDGSGPALFVGGGFMQAGGQSASYVAKWQNSQWQSVGFGFNSNDVKALEEYNDGSGFKLYAAGDFNEACGNASCDSGNITVNGVAAWDGTSWSALGTGITHQGGVLSLLGYKEGYACLTSGPFLFAGGSFTANDAPGNRIVRWDGSQWTPLLAAGDSSSDGVSDGNVRAMFMFKNDDDFQYFTDPVNSLFIGGTFTKVRLAGADADSGNVSEWTCQDYGCIWDIDLDGQVNPVDLGKVQQHFGCDLALDGPECIRSDIDGDCQVNPVDSGLVSAHFGACQP